VADQLPGFIPQVSAFRYVLVLRADETVFNAMADGAVRCVLESAAVRSPEAAPSPAVPTSRRTPDDTSQ
jgi:hypothetical protein